MAKTTLIDAWSFSRYNTYRQCPQKLKWQVEKIMPFKASPAMERGRVVHKGAEDYLKGKLDDVPEPLESRRDILEQLKEMNPLVEEKWGFSRTWEPTGYFTKSGPKKTWLRGSLDAGVDYGDGTFEAIDWKTGKKYDDSEEQMELFGILTLARHPHIEHVTTRLTYVDLPPGPDSEIYNEVKRKDFAALVDKWEEKVRPMFEDEQFLPRANKFCAWCDFSRDNGGPCNVG